jgi:hypothetical protein
MSQGGSPVGMELGGLTVYQSLYLGQVFDYGANVFGPLDVREFMETLLPTGHSSGA